MAGMDTPADIISALGGSAAVQRSLGYRHQSRVSNWRLIGIPRSVWPDLIDLARANRVSGITLATLRRIEAARTKGVS